MSGPSVMPDPRPAVVLGGVASFVAGFATVTAVLAAGVVIVRRWR